MSLVRSCCNMTAGFVRKNYSQLLLLLIFSLLVSLFYPAGRSFKYADLHVGDISQVAIKAPIDFEVLKEEAEIRRDRGSVRMSINPIFSANDTLVNYNRETLGQLFGQLLDTTTVLAEAELPLKLDLTGIEELDQEALLLLRTQLERVLISISGQFIVSNEDLARLSDYQNINVARGAIERVVPTASLIDATTLNSQILERLEKQYPQRDHQVGFRLGVEILRQLIVPNIAYNQAETDRLVEDAIRRVPIARGYVRTGELIVDRHQRITPEAMSQIRSLGRKLAAQQQDGTDDWSLLGRLLMTLIFVGLMTVYLYIFRPAIFSNIRHLNALLLLLLLVLAVVRLEFSYDMGVYATPIPLLGVLLTLIFDLRVGFFLLVLLSMMAGSIYGNDFNYLLVAVVAGIVASWTVRNIQRYSRFLLTVLGVFLAFLIANFGLNLTNFTLAGDIEQDMFIAAVNAVATPVAALILLWLVQLIFGVTSDLQLLKLGQLDHPLLRKLALAAPGTFRQTAWIGRLADEAAKKAGANRLLARSGAYFRDLGKTLNSDSFRENREKGSGELSAAELAPVIRKHVQAGVAIARQHHLPGEIITIIRQHHGTARLSSLLERARKETSPEEIQLADFRYPGELPRTEESTIVMLADAVGGAVLNQGFTSPEEITECVDREIQDKMSGGQLDESVLTMQGLRVVRNRFIEVLVELQQEQHPGREDEVEVPA